MLFYLAKLLFCGFLHVEGNFARYKKKKKNSKYRDVAPLIMVDNTATSKKAVKSEVIEPMLWTQFLQLCNN